MHGTTLGYNRRYMQALEFWKGIGISQTDLQQGRVKASYAMEMYVAKLSLTPSIQSAQTIASYCSAVVDGLKLNGISHNPKVDIYTFRVTQTIKACAKICTARAPEKRFRTRILYVYNLYMQVMDTLDKSLALCPRRCEQSKTFAAIHFGLSCRIGELIHKPMTENRRTRLILLGCDPSLEREKGLRADCLAFIYAKKPPIHAFNSPSNKGLTAISFFTTSKKNQAGITGARGCPTNPNVRYCPVLHLQRMISKYPPTQRGYLFDSWPDKRHLEKDLVAAMRRVACNNGLDPKRFGPHCVRAGTIAAMQAHGAKPREMSIRLGHGSLGSVEAYDNAGIREVLQLQNVIYDERVAPIDEVRFIYMPAASTLTTPHTFTTYSDEVQIDEEEDDDN